MTAMPRHCTGPHPGSGSAVRRSTVALCGPKGVGEQVLRDRLADETQAYIPHHCRDATAAQDHGRPAPCHRRPYQAPSPSTQAKNATCTPPLCSASICKAGLLASAEVMRHSTIPSPTPMPRRLTRRYRLGGWWRPRRTTSTAHQEAGAASEEPPQDAWAARGRCTRAHSPRRGRPD